MTSKAEKLARELIALSERFSERDFDAAAELLLSGKLFARAVETARNTRGAVKHAKRQVSAQHRLALPSDTRLPRKPTDASETPAQLDLDDLLRDVIADEREELISFAKSFQSREILENGASVRVFAQQLGIQLPKSIPARPALLKTLLRELRNIPQGARANLLKEADRIGNGESSLQRWSDLIVKGGAT